MTDRTGSPDLAELAALHAVERRVLWLATSLVHHANKVRPNSSGVKVGGHQASSASMASIMTALWFGGLGPDDRVSVKPHASPVLHAINYVLGSLDRPWLESLRALGGLQAYPSRTKDPDPVDFSTGSVGIGATAPIWAALSRRYVAARVDLPAGGRHISLLGDAELDEGAVWEAVLDATVAELGEVLWVVDLNRQSLDRVVPTISEPKLMRVFDAAGWQVTTLKYGRVLRELFERPDGDALRLRIDGFANPEYQRLLRSGPVELRGRVTGGDGLAAPLGRLLSDVDDAHLRAAVRDLGGHDLGDLMDAFAGASPDRPTVLLAYTVKGRGLPVEGHPANHSALLSDAQVVALAAELGFDPADPWALAGAHSAEGMLASRVADRLRRREIVQTPLPAPPADLGRPRGSGVLSTQEALGRVLTDLTRVDPATAGRIVTVSPDVASSTNLGGWINKVGVFATGERTDWFADDGDSVLRWRESPRGQHIELGIAEVNLVSLLGELGSTWSRLGEPLLPVGTIYDPFINRALEPWTYGMYAGGQSILVGTPSGVTLAAEGGAHQSVTTPSTGLEQPGVVAWEPAFAQDLEWIFLHALSRLGRAGGESAYLRLTTRPMDQSLALLPGDAEGLAERRASVLAGGYTLRRSASRPDVTLVVQGALVPEALAAAEVLAGHEVAADVVCVTSSDLLFRALQARAGLAPGSHAVLDALFPADRAAPMVTLIDGHPHTLTFLGGVRVVPVTGVGVTAFGQSGSLEEVYRWHGIDAETVVGAALDLLDA